MPTNEERRIAPIPLPAASFELRDLLKGLDQAVSVKNVEEHPERIAKAIVEAASEDSKLVLANLNRQAVPVGAKMVEVETVYVEGEEPIVGETPVFEPADAETGEEASKMKYNAKALVGADAVAREEPAPSLSEVAAEDVEEDAAEDVEEDAATAKDKSKG